MHHPRADEGNSVMLPTAIIPESSAMGIADENTRDKNM